MKLMRLTEWQKLYLPWGYIIEEYRKNGMKDHEPSDFSFAERTADFSFTDRLIDQVSGDLGMHSVNFTSILVLIKNIQNELRRLCVSVHWKIGG